MSWQDFQRLINDRNTDVTAWMTAIQANPNTPEDAFKVALLDMIQRQDGAMLEKLTQVVIGMVRNADAMLDVLLERDGFPVAHIEEPVVVIGVDDPRESYEPPFGFIPDFDDLDPFDWADEMPHYGGSNGAGVGAPPPALSL